jgi:hypothetical protein
MRKAKRVFLGVLLLGSVIGCAGLGPAKCPVYMNQPESEFVHCGYYQPLLSFSPNVRETGKYVNASGEQVTRYFCQGPQLSTMAVFVTVEDGKVTNITGPYRW